MKCMTFAIINVSKQIFTTLLFLCHSKLFTTITQIQIGVIYHTTKSTFHSECR